MSGAAHLDIDQGELRQFFDREPMGFTHNLHELGMFKVDSLHRLAEKMSNQPRDVMVAGGASSAGTKFFSVPSIDCKAHEAIENLDRGGYRILLKRAENYDLDFKDLIQTLFRQVKDSLRDFGREKVVRLESGVLITSAATITPFHYDPEVGFFSQIQGDKAYHVYSPTVVREEELERFCARGPVTLAPVELDGRDSTREHVFNLTAGKGFHQPQNAPHWVETGASRSISYTMVFETESMRGLGRVRAFNHYLRTFGMPPCALGRRPAVEVAKSEVMRGLIPLRSRVAKIKKSSLGMTGLKRKASSTG